ncbi:hypothetical protein Droror1_Dr00023602 [Drosera rotundifolia]
MNMSSCENGEIVKDNGSVVKVKSPTLHGSASASPSVVLSDVTLKDTRVSLLSSSFRMLSTPGTSFWQIATERDEISRFVLGPSSSGVLRQRLRGVFSRRIDWSSLLNVCKEWFRNPMNMALFAWIACVAVSGAILFLVMTGMLNAALPKKSQRNAWFEVNNQILNALFTLMCLYNHPKRFHQLVMLCRWNPEDIAALRKAYCKEGTYKPHEWAHMMVVVILLHINCFAQYALCGLNVGYKRSQRPVIGVAICISVAIGSPAVAGLYMIVSPLGKDYDFQSDDESQVPLESVHSTPHGHLRLKSFEKRFSFAGKDERERVVVRPLWRGGILDFWDDISLAYLSLFCSFCVFGWNMERLGFGNMYVHIATFILFCTAPYWIFNLAAINIDNQPVRQALGVSGALLCIFGLLYGGYWRIQMRRRFKLPGYKFCCGKPSVTDCFLWLCCCWCSLAQEVRTGNFYDIVEDKLCMKGGDENIELGNLPLSGEGGPSGFIPGRSSPLVMVSSPSTTMLGSSMSPNRIWNDNRSPGDPLSTVEEESYSIGMGYTMKPPSTLLIDRESI